MCLERCAYIHTYIRTYKCMEEHVLKGVRTYVHTHKCMDYVLFEEGYGYHKFGAC